MESQIEFAVARGALFVAGLFLLMLAVLFSKKKIAPNLIAGVRTKWTLADPEIWYSANRRAIYLIMIVSIICFVFTARPTIFTKPISISIGVIIILAMALDLIFYSKRIYQQKHGTHKVIRTGLFQYRPPKNGE